MLGGVSNVLLSRLSALVLEIKGTACALKLINSRGIGLLWLK